jgi:BON domain-containing protein
MAIDRGDRGQRLEYYPRRGDVERERRERGHDDSYARGREYSKPELDYDDPRYDRASDRFHWRGHDNDDEEQYRRGRDSGDVETETRRFLAPEHRNRFLRRTWNDHEAGPYAGVGPKGYKRSDERILEDVCERLTSHPSIDASDIEVQVSGGDVTLDGRVESRAVKHLTEAMVETVSGVKEVHNQLRVGAVVEGDWPRSAAVERAPESIEPTRRR